MNDADFEEFAKAMASLAEMYGVKLTSKKVTLFFDACRTLSLAQFVEAVKRHMRTQKFFPCPAEIFEALYGTREDQAMMAWCDVLHVAINIGMNRHVKFEDHRIHFAVERMGGWPRVALAIRAGQSWPMKDFKTWYIFALKRGVGTDKVSPYLLGNSPAPYVASTEDLADTAQTVPARAGTHLYRMGLN